MTTIQKPYGGVIMFPITRINPGYAYAQCIAPHEPNRFHTSPTCDNTIKFGEDGTHTVCPSCGATYVCSGNTALYYSETTNP